MDPTQSIDGPIIGSEPAEDEDLMAPASDDDAAQQARGPGEGDARVMAWARAM
jgi:hypothetical protein